jgi:hypothetical protein
MARSHAVAVVLGDGRGVEIEACALNVFSARQDGSKREDDVSGETRELAFRFFSEKKMRLRARPDGFLGPRARFREGFGKFAV